MIAMTGDRSGWQDLMEMSVADWMDMTPSDLMEMAYGDMYSMTPSEWLEAAYGQAGAYGRGGGYGYAGGDDDYGRGGRYGRGGGRTGMREGRGERHRGGRGRYGKGKAKRKGKRDRGCERCGHEEHDCPRCRPDPCQCYCCVGDVDLVVEVRLGERRVIPILIENERRREKEISLELSDWTTRRGGDAPVTTSLITPTQFTLEPCASVEVTIVVDIAGQRDDGNDNDDNPPPSDTPPGTAPPGTPDTPGQGRRLPDVDDCLVVVADLRIVGCDHRPVRIAIAILPRDCDPYTVSCGCFCC